ncbi:ABC transporter substrate-binding protein [uncultured Veillonella sp.]|uniref:ABC transporter substrate-binding protein n=1 Tax=uncultured Veillonella sp. TaxID=159268 RepID=UPI0025EB35FB|nr:ABC transporter substrate-binding protein [uncultured Veillonella sp.]
MKFSIKSAHRYMMRINRRGLMCLGVAVIMLLAGCGVTGEQDGGKKILHYGTTAYGPAMENAGLNPQVAYQGWSAIRYGVGETLVKFSQHMEVEPWLADTYEVVDPHTVQFHIREGVTFSNGKALTGDAVKESLEALVAKHNRAARDLKIRQITAQNQQVTIQSEHPAAVLLTYLADPYSTIIDVAAGESNRIVIGTGPFKATEVTDSTVKLVRNDTYWNGQPKLDGVDVQRITDGDTLTMALQRGDIDAAQGLPYSSIDLFNNNKDYRISSVATSRVYQMAFNFKSPNVQDKRVREAIAMGINKADFVTVLLKGNGLVGEGPFPNTTALGQMQLQTVPYDLNKAKALLAEAGYVDQDGDGYVEKEGKPLVIRWLTYTSRQELPLLAEMAQSSLKDMGIKVEVNATDSYLSSLKQGEFEIFAKAFVTAPTGEGSYYFKTNVLAGAVDNVGGYDNPKISELDKQLDQTIDPATRQSIFQNMTQAVLDDQAFVYVAFLKMNLVTKAYVTHFDAYPSDYYEINKDIDIVR